MGAIKQYHPAVGFCYFTLMVVVSLASMQPVFLALSFVAALAYALAVLGLKAFLRSQWWLALLILVVVLVNGVFGGKGLTVLFVLNLGFVQTPVTLESLVYGLCMGCMLAGVILWFVVFGCLSSEQGLIELFTKVSPTLGMMIARTTLFIPELLAQARLINQAQRSFWSVRKEGAAYPAKPLTECSEGSSASRFAGYAEHVPEQLFEKAPAKLPKKTRRARLAYAGALCSHLMEWGMEKSLITANSMMARGYGSRRRTSFRRTRLTLCDTVLLVVIAVLGLASLACVLWAGTAYTFYPYLSPVGMWWGFVPYLLLAAVPLALQLREELAWWQHW